MRCLFMRACNADRQDENPETRDDVRVEPSTGKGGSFDASTHVEGVLAQMHDHDARLHKQ